MGGSLAQVLRHGASHHPQRPAIIALDERGSSRKSYSYGEVDFAARAVAGGLQQAGVGPGDHVALCAENSMEYVAAYFGVLYVGAAVVPIPILSAAPEVRFRAEHARCKAIICDHKRQTLVEQACGDLNHTRRLVLAELVECEHSTDRPANRNAQDTAMVLYTSGTTGSAKGAAISHGALLTHTAVLAYHALRLDESDRILGVLPLTHSFGCRMAMLSSLYAGASSVLMPRFDAAACMEVMLREQVTWLPAVPTMFAALGQLPEVTPKPTLRWAMCAGAPVPEETTRRAEARLGCEIRQGYGMTEATIATLNAPPDARVIASVGKPVWGIELLILDERRQELPQGQAGEVWIRGHNTMSGYLDDRAATSAIEQDGFLRSGDVGYLDAEGRLYIIDRIKDLILRGGNNVYPSEVESALAEHPAIAQVAVVGRPDDYYGEEVVAVIHLKASFSLTADEVSQWSRERVSKTKVPREVAFVDQFPLGPSGKILKRQLRQDIVAGRLKTTRCS